MESLSREASKEAISTSASGPEIRGGKKVRRAIWPVLDRQFQIKATLFILLLVLLSHLFLLVLHYRNFDRAAQGAIGKDPAEIQIQMKKQRTIWARDLALGIVVISVAVGLTVFYLTQKVSGPLFAMSRILDDVSQGDIKARVNLRHDDYLHWFGDKINHTLDVLEKKAS